MRITIEPEDDMADDEPSRPQRLAGVDDEAATSGAINAGPPPEALVSAIAEAGGSQPSQPADDGGPAPSE